MRKPRAEFEEITGTIKRRDFLKIVGATVAAGVTERAFPEISSLRKVVVMLDRGDPVVASEPVQMAAVRLLRVLKAKGVDAETLSGDASGRAWDMGILIAGPHSSLADTFPKTHGDSVAEGFRIVSGSVGNMPAVWVSGIDNRGVAYGVLELADRIEFGQGVVAALRPTAPLEEKPANKVRSIARSYVSDIEDRGWFYDKGFWVEYLDMLVASRFNRFALTFGLNYDYPKGVTEDYFHFLYPYLFDVPGYSVRVTPALEAGEQRKNLETVQFIARETARRGMEFQLGLWSHGYEWVESPNAQHKIVGLTPQTHAAYCRDSLALLLKSCPEITGLTFRIHEESGIPQGQYDFWDVLFSRVKDCGRQVELDLHAKSLKQPLMDSAVRTGLPLKVSPKFAAEHVGLGYQQASIREMEMPKSYEINGSGKFDLGKGIRGFLRYGYGDLIQEGRPYELLYRVWPGTQRHLLWGDPVLAAGWSRAASFCGGVGMEVFEPLAFKGREGSGVPGGRNAYADATLEPEGGDWRKFEYTYRVLGRTLYNPDTPDEVWRRYLRRDFGRGAPQVEIALSEAGRLMPLVTNAYLPSSANQWYWPELYTHLQIVPEGPVPYYDTQEPMCFGTAETLDPQLFSRPMEHAKELLSGTVSSRYTGLEVAEWLDSSVARSNAALAAAKKLVPSTRTPAFRRMEEDVLIQNALGTFFACKMRAGLFYEIFHQSDDPASGALAVKNLRKARDTWSAMAERAKNVYRLNIAYGDKDDRRGHWVDRLPAIDLDLKHLEAAVKAATVSSDRQNAALALSTATTMQRRVLLKCIHETPHSFTPGKELNLKLILETAHSSGQVTLFYRHVDQAERWSSVTMVRNGNKHISAIPATYTDSPFPLQYYFSMNRNRGEAAWMYPALGPELIHQPYFVVEARTT
jgi:hypothetical protein